MDYHIKLLRLLSDYDKEIHKEKSQYEIDFFFSFNIWRKSFAVAHKIDLTWLGDSEKNEFGKMRKFMFKE